MLDIVFVKHGEEMEKEGACAVKATVLTLISSTERTQSTSIVLLSSEVVSAVTLLSSSL